MVVAGIKSQLGRSSSSILISPVVCRTPVWLVSYFNDSGVRESGQAQLFENIYRRCQFTPVRPG